jgi:hypothetical protein
MKILPVFKFHGHVSIAPEIIKEFVDYPWHSVKQSYDNDPLLPSNNIYVMLNHSPNINLPPGFVPNALTNSASSIVSHLRDMFVGQICLRALVVNLPAETAQHWHVDPRMMHELSHRVHVAIHTNSDSVIEIENQQQHFAIGEVWEFDNLRPHRANNRGSSNRIHLITDWMPTDVYEQHQHILATRRPEILDNLGVLYLSKSGKCLFSPEKS